MTVNDNLSACSPLGALPLLVPSLDEKDTQLTVVTVSYLSFVKLGGNC